MSFVKMILKCAVLFAALSSTFSPALLAQEKDPLSKEDVQDILVEYLEQNPEIVVMAIQEFQRRQQVAQMLPKIKVYRDYLENDPSYPVLGNPKGSITIVEFFDYRCGFCKRNFPFVRDIIEKNPDVRFIARQYPVLDRAGQKPLSKMAAQAALAADKQGKFKEFHNALMTLEQSLTEDVLYATARTVGLNVSQLKEDMQDKLIDKTITNTLAIGQEIGFTGTPSYFIGDDVAVGAQGFFRLQQAVDRARTNKWNPGLTITK